MTRTETIDELRRLARLDTVRLHVASAPASLNATTSQQDAWKRELRAAFKALNKARAQYRPRALAALEAVRFHDAAPAGWPPSQGTLASWEDQLAWAAAAPFDVDAKVAEFVERFEAERSRTLYG